MVPEFGFKDNLTRRVLFRRNSHDPSNGAVDIQPDTVNERTLKSFGIELVAQEGNDHLVVFIDENAKQEFYKSKVNQTIAVKFKSGAKTI